MTRTVETASEFVRVEVDSSIATIRVDRPPMNPLSIEVQDALGEPGRGCDEPRRNSDPAGQHDAVLHDPCSKGPEPAAVLPQNR